MNAPFKLTLLTILGARSAHRGLSAAFRQPFFDHRAAKLPRETLEKAVRNARYFATSNTIRASFYVPVVIGLRGTGHWFSLWLMATLIVFHLICVLAENYKASAARFLLATGAFTEEKEPPRALPSFDMNAKSYFTPKKIESEELYRWIGVEFVRKIVNIFNDYTQLTSEERKSGRKPQQLVPTKAGILLYEADTRESERMHIIAGSLNIPPLVSFILLSKWSFALWVGFVIFIDFSLVLLQRYLRVRVVSRLRKIEERRAARTAVAT